MLKYFYRKNISTKRLLYACRLQPVRKQTTYNIETSHGIYQIQEEQRVNQLTDQNIPSILKTRCLEFYTLQVNNCIVEDLIELNTIGNKLKSQNKDFLNGFICDNNGDNIQRSLVYVGDNTNDIKNVVSKYNLRKVAFYWDLDDKYLYKNINNGVADAEKHFKLRKYSNVHPSLTSPQHRPVYKTYKQSLETLSKLSKLDISPMISEFGSRRIEHMPDVNKRLHHPFIVVEGLDGTGKSTMVANLSRYLNAVAMATPPDSIRHIRKEFDNLPELCRRSFYAFSNYLASSEISHVTEKTAVVLDRYWHSTTAYAMAKEAAYGVTEHLPSSGDPIYNWPVDLLKPTAIVYLTTPEKNRDNRLNDRDEMTYEEIEISENEKLRKRIKECYCRIGYDKWIEVDTSGTQEESLQKAVSGLKEQNVIP